MATHDPLISGAVLPSQVFTFVLRFIRMRCATRRSISASVVGAITSAGRWSPRLLALPRHDAEEFNAVLLVVCAQRNVSTRLLWACSLRLLIQPVCDSPLKPMRCVRLCCSTLSHWSCARSALSPPCLSAGELSFGRWWNFLLFHCRTPFHLRVPVPLQAPICSTENPKAQGLKNFLFFAAATQKLFGRTAVAARSLTP